MLTSERSLRNHSGAYFLAKYKDYIAGSALFLFSIILTSRGLSHIGEDYSNWSLDHQAYSDFIQLAYLHYLRIKPHIHPLPYFSDKIEYPVLLGWLLWVQTLIAGPVYWFVNFVIVNYLSLILSIWTIRRLANSSDASLYFTLSPSIALTALINWDLVGLCLFLLSCHFFNLRRYELALLLCAIGTSFKLYPLALLPFVITYLWRTNCGQESFSANSFFKSKVISAIAIFVGSILAINLPEAIGNLNNFYWFYSYSNLRTAKDAIWSILPENNHVSVAIANYGTVVVLALLFIFLTRVRLSDTYGSAAYVQMACSLLFLWISINKVWNPQYSLWLIACFAVLQVKSSGIKVTLWALVQFAIVEDYLMEFYFRTPGRFASSGLIFISNATRLAIFLGAFLILMHNFVILQKSCKEDISSAV